MELVASENHYSHVENKALGETSELGIEYRTETGQQARVGR